MVFPSSIRHWDLNSWAPHHNNYLPTQPRVALFSLFVSVPDNKHLNHNLRAGALVQWLFEETHVLKVVDSNPSTIHWMDIFHIFCWKICLKRRKTKKRPGWPIKNIKIKIAHLRIRTEEFCCRRNGCTNRSAAILSTFRKSQFWRSAQIFFNANGLECKIWAKQWHKILLI